MRRLEDAEVGLERLRVLDVDGEAGGKEGVEGVEGYEADTGSRLDGGHYQAGEETSRHLRRQTVLVRANLRLGRSRVSRVRLGVLTPN